jgi:hypothetical protein
MSLAVRSSYMRFSKDCHPEDPVNLKNKLTNKNQEKYKDELIKAKEEVNKKRQESTLLKIENSKLIDENNKNIKIIESFLTEAGKNVGEYLLGKSNEYTNGNGIRNPQGVDGSK